MNTFVYTKADTLTLTKWRTSILHPENAAKKLMRIWTACQMCKKTPYGSYMVTKCTTASTVFSPAEKCGISPLCATMPPGKCRYTNFTASTLKILQGGF